MTLATGAMTVTAAQFEPGAGVVVLTGTVILDGRIRIDGAEIIRRPGGLSVRLPVYSWDLPCRWMLTPLAPNPLPVIPLSQYHYLESMATLFALAD